MIFEHMTTLQEFMTSTKAACYLVAAVYLASFPLFWRYLVGRDKKE